MFCNGYEMLWGLVVFWFVLINGCQWLFETNHDFIQVLWIDDGFSC